MVTACCTALCADAIPPSTGLQAIRMLKWEQASMSAHLGRTPSQGSWVLGRSERAGAGLVATRPAAPCS